MCPEAPKPPQKVKTPCYSMHARLSENLKLIMENRIGQFLVELIWSHCPQSIAKITQTHGGKTSERLELT